MSFSVKAALLLVSVGVLLPVGVCGCGPDLKGYMGPVLAPANIGLAEKCADADHFVILQNESSSGRFPAAIAVARVEPVTNPSPGSRTWRVRTLKKEPAAYWNQLFNAIPEVRELMILNERTPLPRGEGVQVIATGAGRLHAGLCLVYGPAHAEVGEAALIGHLMDAQTGESLACLMARATRADFETARDDRMSGDKRHQDVEYLAARKFEKLFRECVTELIHRDSPPTTTKPSKWHGSTPPEKNTIYVVPEQPRH